jgi:DNA polymerase-3 subunit delta'
MSANPYPWHRAVWDRLGLAIEADRLGHALLLQGRTGVGKSLFVDALTARLLCEGGAENTACGRCRSCALLAAGSHPDLTLITVPEGKSGIGIDQIRALIEYFTLVSHYGRRKIAVLRPADAMNRATANALLKVLEEPPAGALLVLETARPEALLPTLRSRCQRLVLEASANPETLTWLSAAVPGKSSQDLKDLLWVAGGGPLLARHAAEEGWLATVAEIVRHMAAVAQGRMHATQAAQATEPVGLLRLADFMILVCHALLAAAAEGRATHCPGGADLNALADGLNSKVVADFLTEVLTLKAQALQSATLRQTDLVDALWLAWMKGTRTHKRRA